MKLVQQGFACSAICRVLAALLTGVMIAGALYTPSILAQVNFDNSILSLGSPVRQINGVNSIVQDKFGFIWIGGENGLGRYDGTRLILYQANATKPGSLPNNFIWKLLVDHQGRLWVATSNGLCIYHPETDNFEPVTQIDGQPLLPGTTNALAVDGTNKLYAASAFGLNIIDIASQTLEIIAFDSKVGANVILDIALDKDGSIWMATALKGLVRLNPNTGHVDHFDHDEANPDSITFSTVKRVHPDANGRIWVGTYGGGINILDPETGKAFQIDYQLPGLGNGRSSIVMDMLEDSQGYIWVSIDQQGLLKFDKNFALVQHFSHSTGNSNSLLSNKPRALFEDANGDLWVGGFPFGVSFLKRSQQSIRTYQSDAIVPTSLSNDGILSLLQHSDGTIWVGTEAGLNALDPDTQKFTRYISDPDNPEALASNPILSLAEDASGDLWVGTWSGGLHRFDLATKKFKRYGHNLDKPTDVAGPFVWTLLRDRDNIIWLGTEIGGLQRYRPETDDFRRYQHDPEDPSSISSNNAHNIIEDRKGRLWIATFAGVNMFDKKTETFTHYKPEPGNPESLSTQAIRSIFEDSRGYIWAGGHEGGINRLDPATGKVKRIGVADGLPSDTVSTIQEDKNGFLWLGTHSGLARLNPDNFAITVFNVEHGLVSGNYNRDASLLDKDGTLYFGSTEGMTAFKPEDMTINATYHPIRITNFRILNQEVKIGAQGSSLTRSILTTDAIELKYSDDMFSFDFVMLNYRKPELNRYAYKLEGFDADWNYVEQRNTATYTNLDPGRYVFHVKAKAPGEEWSESDHSITIDIAPPAWRTWWAYSLYLILALGFIYTVYAIGRLKITSDNYRALSITDPLTHVYNRAGIAQILRGLFVNKEIKNGVGIMMMDVDHFKKINDQLGHDVGDHVITEIVHVITSVIRQSDYFGRWGGEEFILLCPGSHPVGVRQLAEKIRAAIAGHEFNPNGTSLRATLSIGIALVHADETFEQALKRADIALYEAKRNGRNCIVLADAASLQK